jgi:hypothetical protein
LDVITNAIKTKKIKNIFLASITSILIASMFYRVIFHACAVFASKDTRTLAKEWIHKNIPKNSKIAIEWYAPPISEKKYKILNVKALGKRNLNFYKKHGIQYIIISSLMYERFFLSGKEHFPQEIAFYDSLLKKTKMISSFQGKRLPYINPTIKIFAIHD